MTLKEFKWFDTTSIQWFQEALLEQSHNLVRQRILEQGLLKQNQKRHQATGFRVQGIGERRHAWQGRTGLSDTCGMGNMKGASEGNLNSHLTSHFCVVARSGTLNSIHMHIDFELFTAFSYTESPKTEQGGDNQAWHVALTLESGISLPEAPFPVNFFKPGIRRKKGGEGKEKGGVKRSKKGYRE